LTLNKSFVKIKNPLNISFLNEIVTMEIKMKIKQNHFSMILFIFLLFTGSIFSQGSGLILLDFKEDLLKERLQLTPQQVESVKDIIKMLQAQENLDRQNFKANAIALVAAAVRRAQMGEMKLSFDLSDSQKKILMDLKKEQSKFREFFSLKEGLLLSEEQVSKIKTIIQIFASKRPVRGDDYENMADLMDPMGYGYGYNSGYGMPGNLPNMVPGTTQNQIPGSMQRNMARNRHPHAMRMSEGLIDKLKNHEAQKEKAIDVILTLEQKKLFKQLKEERHKELEMMFEKMRQDQNSQ
jgi:hypothetical protein